MNAPTEHTQLQAPARRTYDAEASLVNILEVATAEFADKGLSGARIDEIAARTRTSKRMIYYHFTSKEDLYLAVLENAYRRLRDVESNLQLDDLEPEDALRRLVGHTFDHHVDNEPFIRLVMNENMQRGQYLSRSTLIHQANMPAIDGVRSVYQRGVEAGLFRRGLDPVDVHWSISALCFFHVANHYTFTLIFDRDKDPQAVQRARRDLVIDMVVRNLRR
jgi:AcrR family transcriptional regulator